MSLLTPQYQQYLAQETYHQGNTNVAHWQSQYCWPEGFMRRFDAVAIQPQINPHVFVVTPDLVTISTGVAVALQNDGVTSREAMVSVKILR